MAKFKVVLEIELEADCPLTAAKTFKTWLEESADMIYIVQSEDGTIVSVDLNECFVTFFIKS